MNKITKRLLVFLIILFISYLLLRVYIKKIMDGATFQISSSYVLPTSIGYNYKEIIILNNEKKITAWMTEPDPKSNVVIILFNGIGGNRSDWIHFQNILLIRE